MNMIKYSFLGLVAGVSAVPSLSVQNTCLSLQQSLPGQVSFQGDKFYEHEISDYWHGGIRGMKPACVLHPTSTISVSTAVKILSDAPQQVKFAVKSGGHDPNRGHSSIHEGVLIAMRYINGTTYDPSRQVAYVRPGGNWVSVIRTLKPFNRTVVGGRVGVVGIGGYLTQGGLSFLSAQHGMGADNVVEFETVMANSTVVRVTQETHPDLMVAMQGGGSQYGIVAQFMLRTYHMERIWGGLRAYAPSQVPDLLPKLHKFIGEPKDSKAAIIFITRPSANNGTFVAMYYFYDGPKPPPGVSCGLEDVKPMADVTAEIDYETILGGFGPSAFPSSLGCYDSSVLPSLTVRNSFRSLTVPHLPNDPAQLQRIIDMHVNTTSKVKSRWIDQNNHGSLLVFQPFPTSIAKATAERGGNAMGLKESDGAHFILEIHQMWFPESGEPEYTKFGQEFVKAVQGDINTTAPENYSPCFMNDAASDQKVFASYREVRKFADVQTHVDPNALWQRSGGFKMF